MNRLFEKLDRKSRAQALRAAARDCEQAGFIGIAEVNWDMAELLDPTPREERRAGTVRNPDGRSAKGSNHQAVRAQPPEQRQSVNRAPARPSQGRPRSYGEHLARTALMPFSVL